jgi:predicted TIM-barrel fold metal-dependent hydrolase
VSTPAFQVDTHVHVIADDEGRYPLNPSGATGAWYREDPCSIGRLVDLMDVAGVDAAVLVQGISAYRFDNRYTLDAAAQHPERCTSVVCVDLGGADPASEVTALLDRGAGGLRWVALHDGGVEEPRAVWDIVSDRRIPVVVTLLDRHLPGLAEALPRLPEVLLALDHCGFADLSHGLPDALTALAAFPAVHLKVSTIALDAAAEHGDVRDFLSDLAACFGATRLMWGSDYSQTHDRPYPALADYARFASSKLGDDDRALFLGLTACTVWPELQ